MAGRAPPARGASEPAEGNPHRPHPEGRARARSPRTSRPSCSRRASGWSGNALAACVLHPSLVKLLAEVSPEHFDSDLHRRFQAHLVQGGAEDEQLLALRAELDARAAREGLDERTGKELLLHLRERRLRRELAGAELERIKELQSALARVQAAVAELA